MFAFNGTTKEVTVSGVSTFTADELHEASVAWSVLEENMQFLMPTEANGKFEMGTSIFSDLIFRVLNGWKLKPSGYSASDTIAVVGTIIAQTGTLTTPPTVGACPVWIFTVASNGMIMESSTGAGLTVSAIADEVMSRGVATDVSVEEIIEDNI